MDDSARLDCESDVSQMEFRLAVSVSEELFFFAQPGLVGCNAVAKGLQTLYQQVPPSDKPLEAVVRSDKVISAVGRCADIRWFRRRERIANADEARMLCIGLAGRALCDIQID